MGRQKREVMCPNCKKLSLGGTLLPSKDKVKALETRMKTTENVIAIVGTMGEVR